MSPNLFWEFLRKFLHLSSLLIVLTYAFLLHYFSERIAILGLTTILLILIEIDYIRLEHQPKIVNFFKQLYRPHERNNISASIFMVISSIICFAAFDYWVAFLGLLMTVFGDMFAALIGKTVGGPAIFHQKTLSGTLAGFLANFIVGFMLLPGFMLLVIPMAITATFVELATNKLDDNLTVPLFSCFVGQLTVYFAAMTLPLPGFWPV